MKERTSASEFEAYWSFFRLKGELILMSKYTKDDIIRMVEEEGIDFIRMQFTDIFGQAKNVAIIRLADPKSRKQSNLY